MIAVDSSAIVALLTQEPDDARCALALGIAVQSVISASSYVEICTVMLKRNCTLADIEAKLKLWNIKVVPFTKRQARIAGGAVLRYGKGHSNNAKLNLGDLHSYALAKDRGLKLLFVGNDFTHTDLEAA